jgi:hypothetical protein
MDDAMTDDRSAKKAARARMAATGEPYSTARRAVQNGPDRPAPLARPPAIDPREHAVHSRHWGVLACYLVRYQGRYSAWITGAYPGDRSQVYAMPSEPAGRAFTDGWQVMNLGDFGDLGEALEEFAALAERAADRLGSGQAVGKPDLFAGVLRYRAATVRAGAARAALGDVIRRHQPRAGTRDGLHPLWHEAGLPPESLGRVLAGQDWAWPQHPWSGPPARGCPTHPPPRSPPAPSTATAST